MTESAESPEFCQTDYAVIESAVLETARGRWFLAEYARRNRHSDTEVLLTSLARIEKSAAESRHTAGFDRFRIDLVDMAKSIERTRTEIRALSMGSDSGQTPFGNATGELDAIVKATEAATTEILGAAETVQEVAWTLREGGESQTYIEGCALCCRPNVLRATWDADLETFVIDATRE